MAGNGWQLKSRLSGVDSARKSLKAFPQALQNRVLRKATTKASGIIAKVAKANAPTDSKLLKKSIGSKVRTYKKSNAVLGFIGPRLGYKGTVNGKNRDPRYYAHIAERGRRAVTIKNKRVLSDGKRFFGKSVKAAPGKHFLERTFKQTQGQATTVMVDIIKTGVVVEAEKLAAKAAKK